MNSLELKLFANDIRQTLIQALASKGGGHIGGTLSICDLLAVLYGDVMRYRPQEPDWEGRDYLVCSKGHAAPAIYAALAFDSLHSHIIEYRYLDCSCHFDRNERSE